MSINFTLPQPVTRILALFLAWFVIGGSNASAQGGRVVSWGISNWGQTNVPPNLSEVVAITAGFDFSVALKQDGTVVAWGHNDTGQTNVPGNLSGVKAIAAGISHVVALRQDGTVTGWGDNSYGQTDVPAGLSAVVAIAAGGGHNLALKQDGTVVAWGYNSSGETVVPAGLSDVVAIAAGDEHSVALKGDGTVVAWGNHGYSQTAVPGLTHVKAIAAGAWHTVALMENGQVAAWGRNEYGQSSVPGGLSGVKAIAAGSFLSMALKQDGTVFSWGASSLTQPPVGLGGVVAVAAGDQQSLALVWGDQKALLRGEAIGFVQVAHGFVVGVTLIDGGSGYTNAPAVRIVGGGGSGATATATVKNGQISGITVTSAGNGYADVPTLVIASPALPPTIGIEVSEVSVEMTVVPGEEYLLESSEDSAIWTPVGEAFVAESALITQQLDVRRTGGFFRISRVGSTTGGSGGSPRQATGVAQVINGFVVDLAITDSGAGYTSQPVVRIVGGGGIGATGVATVNNGQVTGISVTSAGSGYTTTPDVIIAIPLSVPKVVVRPSKVAVNLELILGKNYLLESSTDLAVWHSVEAIFVAENEALTQEFDVGERGRFFRISQVP